MFQIPKTNSNRERSELSIQSLFARVINNKKEIDTGLKNVKIDLGNIYQEHEKMRSELSQTNQLIAASKEADNMSDIIELKTRVGNIETTVNKLVTDVAVINNTLELRFNNTDAALKDIKDTLKEMKTEGVTSKRYSITTSITAGALIVAILACIAVWYNATK